MFGEFTIYSHTTTKWLSLWKIIINKCWEKNVCNMSTWLQVCNNTQDSIIFAEMRTEFQIKIWVTLRRIKCQATHTHALYVEICMDFHTVFVYVCLHARFSMCITYYLLQKYENIDCHHHHHHSRHRGCCCRRRRRRRRVYVILSVHFSSYEFGRNNGNGDDGGNNTNTLKYMMLFALRSRMLSTSYTKAHTG